MHLRDIVPTGRSSPNPLPDGERINRGREFTYLLISPRSALGWSFTASQRLQGNFMSKRQRPGNFLRRIGCKGDPINSQRAGVLGEGGELLVHDTARESS